MATEKRLIRADVTVDAFTKWLTSTYDGRMPADIVNEIPTVDAVEVVRCKDCKHWKPITEHIPHMECDIFCGAYEHGYPTNADDFCSYGERRTDGAQG